MPGVAELRSAPDRLRAPTADPQRWMRSANRCRCGRDVPDVYVLALEGQPRLGPSLPDHLEVLIGDATSAREMVGLLKGMRDLGKTIFVVTHQAALLDGVADEFVWMQDGQIIDRTASVADHLAGVAR